MPRYPLSRSLTGKGSNNCLGLFQHHVLLLPVVFHLQLDLDLDLDHCLANLLLLLHTSLSAKEKRSDFARQIKIDIGLILTLPLSVSLKRWIKSTVVNTAACWTER